MLFLTAVRPDREKKDNQWLGVSVASMGSEDGYAVVGDALLLWFE